MVEKPAQPLSAFGIKNMERYGRLNKSKEYGCQADGVDHARKGNLAWIRKDRSDIDIVPDGSEKGPNP